MMPLSKPFTRREKILLCLLGLILVGSTYYFAVHQPVERALQTLSVQQEDTQARITTLEETERYLNEMRAELETILSQPNPTATPKYDNLQQVMVFLNTTLSATDDYSLAFQPVEVPEDGSVVRRVIQMSFTCPSYEQTRSVVETLYHSIYRCQLSNLSLSSDTPGKKGQGGDLTVGSVRVDLTATFFESLH